MSIMSLKKIMFDCEYHVTLYFFRATHDFEFHDYDFLYLMLMLILN